MKRMYEVVNITYNLNGTWTEEIFFHGSKEDCLDWLKTHCSVSEYPGETQYWLGNKHLEIFKAE